MATINGTSSNDTLIGTVGDDIIYGLDGNDALFGRDGADHLFGGAGDDQLKGEAGDDLLFGDDGDDRLFGGIGRDSLAGGAGNDLLDGGLDGDQMGGGPGDDIYVVDSFGDSVFEQAGNGIDSVQASSAWHLADNVENLTITITGGDASTQYGGMGNNSANIMIGIGAAFQFHGLGGDDRLYGSAGADFLNGGAGTDIIEGGDGGDIYWIDKVEDHAAAEFFDRGSSGIDEVRVASYAGGTVTLFADDIGIERVSLLDTSALSIDVSAVRNAMQLSGNSFANQLTGTAFADQIDGGGGADILTGGSGKDILSGGDGLDTAVFSDLFRSYSINVMGGFGTVSGARDGNDTVASIEVMQFKDGKFMFDVDGVAAQVTRLYDTVLRRGPDQVGLDYWVDRLEDHGGNLKQIAVGFLNSGEFQARTGKLSDADYVDFLYTSALGRSSDASGKNYWVEQLESGAKDRADLLIGFSESPEHRQLTTTLVSKGFFNTDDNYQAVALLYDTFAGRRPDAAGLIYWAEALKSGKLSLDEVADGFANSPEFRQSTQGMTNSELVNFMYLNTLDRPADVSGSQFWTARLDAGMDRGDLILGFSQSNEHFILLGAQVTNGIDYFA